MHPPTETYEAGPTQLEKSVHDTESEGSILLLDTLYHEFTSTHESAKDRSTSATEVDGPSGTVAWKKDGGEWKREDYIEKVRASHPKYAQKIQWCGSHGPKRLVFGNNLRLVGARCDCVICDICAPIRARKNAIELMAVVDNLILKKGINPNRIVVGRLIMSNQHHSPKDQIDLLSNTVNRARDLSWWRDAIWGDEEAIHASGNGRINAYLYTLLVLKPDADLDKFKQKCFSYFQKRIGYELVKWDSTAEQWGEWLKIAEIKPELFHYIHGNMLKAGSGYKNFFYRNQGDLNQLIQCYSNRDSVSRGGVIAEIRKEQGFNIHKKKAFSNQQPTIPFWRDVPQDIKIAFENLVINNALDRDIKTYLITQAQLCTLEVWQNLVMEAVGQCGFEKITSIDGLDEFLYESTADDPYFKLLDEAPSRAREKAIWGYRYPGAPS